MRHSIELALKENIKYLSRYSELEIKNIKTHKLSVLFNEFERHYDKIASELRFEDELKPEYEKYTKEIKKIIEILGIESSSFRYVNSSSNTKVFDHTKIINIYDLKKKFDSSIVFFTHTADVISPYTNFVDYIKFDNSIISNAFGIVLHCFNEFQKDWLIGEMNKRYEIITKDEVWKDNVASRNLHLKITNNKCYIIPMKE